MKFLIKSFILLQFLNFSFTSQASENGMVHVVNWFEILASMFFGEKEASYLWPIVSSLFVLLLIILIGIGSNFYKLVPEQMTDEELLPSSKFGLSAFVELSWAVISHTTQSILGTKYWQKHVSFLAGSFFFILFCNLSGLVPGFVPATEQMNMTVPMAIIVFILFNFYGFKHGGWNYVKHLMGPVWWLIPLLFSVEVISLFIRPVSLSLRLFLNISGDHLIFSVFSTILRDASMPFLPLPALLLVLGTLVACVQAYVFATLATLYIKLALDTDEHHEHAHH